MKKILFLALLSGSLIFGAIPCFAVSEGNVFVGNDESDEILKDMDLILEDVSFLEIGQEDLDMNRIIRDYVDIDIFKENIKSPDEMREYLKNAKYIYSLPVNKENADYCLVISKGPKLRQGAELTEKEKKYVEEREGRWGSPVVGACENETDPPIIDYNQKMKVFLSCYGIEKSETFFVGGVTTESVVTGICFAEGRDEPYYVALDKIDSNACTADDIKDAVYTYDEMKEYAIEFGPGLVSGGGIGSAGTPNNPLLTYIIAIAALAVIVAVILIVRKKCIGKAKG